MPSSLLHKFSTWGPCNGCTSANHRVIKAVSMSSEVFANGNAVACKAGDGKVIAAFPDVCLSPPSPPAGPVPVPYPDTSFSKDMQNGSKTVKINGKEVMLKDKSFYKTSPLGDETATRSFGANVITHVITGKTYFVAWSMDVKFEGQNVDRHLDLTTSNHASYPGGTGPMSDMEKLALARIAADKCPCCGEDMHEGQKGAYAANEDEWYGLDEGELLDQERAALTAVDAHLARMPAAVLAQHGELRVLPRDLRDQLLPIVERREALEKRKELVKK